MPQPIWPTCIAFRHKLQSITQAEINACHLGYAFSSMRAMHHLYVPPCFLQQSPSLTFFASHPSYVNFCFCFFFFFLLFNRSQNYSRTLLLFYSPLWKHSFEDSWFSRIRNSTIIFMTSCSSFVERVSLSSTQPEDQLPPFRSIPSRIYIIHAGCLMGI